LGVSQPVRVGVLALVAAFAVGLLWLGVVRYRAEQRAVAAAAAMAPGETPEMAIQKNQVPQEQGRPKGVVKPETPSERPRPQVIVHVTGAVLRPGVYHLEPGARVADAVEAAGGASIDGMADALNLASHVSDGDKIFVPSRREEQVAPVVGQGATKLPVQAESRGSAGSSAGRKVNVNVATQAELDSLPGVSPKLAGDIVAYREKYGRFKSLDDLDKVTGVGPTTLKQLKQYTTL